MNGSSFFPDSIKKIPLGLGSGAVYRCSMPCYKSYNPDVELQRDLATLKAQKISHIVLLAQDHECEFVTGADLRAKYGENGFVVHHFPIPAGGLPDQKALALLLDQIEREARSGCRIAVHCQKGSGRTGLVTACLAARVLNISGVKAVEWVKDYIPNAVESEEQIAFISAFCRYEQQALFEKSIIPLPFEFKEGCIFRSQMPGYKQEAPDIQHDIEMLKLRGITHVALLASDADCLKHSGVDLKSAYESAGLTVLHFPIPDFGTPEKEALASFIERVEHEVQSGAKFVVHCTAGKGRTGLFLSCLARKVFGFQGKEAIEWVRESIPGAVETTAQRAFVEEFIKDQPPSQFAQSLIHLPYHLKSGMIYRSVMPGTLAESHEDLANLKRCVTRDILNLKGEGISQVLMLIPEEESLHCLGGIDLNAEYAKHGILVHHLPIKEGEVPETEDLEQIFQKIIPEVSQGKRLAIHCRFGIGRTALVAACFAKKVLKLKGDPAVKWVEHWIPGVSFNLLQKEFVKRYNPEDKCNLM